MVLTPPKHEYASIFALLRAEAALQYDGNMADYLESEASWRGTANPDSKAGRAFALAIAEKHGVEGIRSLHRALTTLHGATVYDLPTDPSDVRMDDALRAEIARRSDYFRLGATVFCEHSGVYRG